MKWIVIKERESQRWTVAGQTEWRTEEYYPQVWSRRMKKRRVQKGYVYPRPEHVSPFIEAHSVIDASTIEEATCLISSWR